MGRTWLLALGWSLCCPVGRAAFRGFLLSALRHAAGLCGGSRVSTSAWTPAAATQPPHRRVSHRLFFPGSLAHRQPARRHLLPRPDNSLSSVLRHLPLPAWRRHPIPLIWRHAAVSRLMRRCATKGWPDRDRPVTGTLSVVGHRCVSTCLSASRWSPPRRCPQAIVPNCLVLRGPNAPISGSTALHLERVVRRGATSDPLRQAVRLATGMAAPSTRSARCGDAQATRPPSHHRSRLGPSSPPAESPTWRWHVPLPVPVLLLTAASPATLPTLGRRVFSGRSTRRYALLTLRGACDHLAPATSAHGRRCASLFHHLERADAALAQPTPAPTIHSSLRALDLRFPSETSR